MRSEKWAPQRHEQSIRIRLPSPLQPRKHRLPLPNPTGFPHVGRAMDNVMRDVLTR
ncbi:MAG: hypothetical protein ACUVYA_07760 [Planctomycetota bacterium]